MHARLLILMESPATRTVASAGSGFCSMDNADGTNRLLASLVAKAGISRAQCIKWNTVPWALTDEDGRPRAARRADINAGAEHVREVLTLTTELDIVLTLGNAALAGFMLAVTAETPAQLYRVLAAPHPSQRNAGSRSTSLRRIENALSAISMEFRSARSRRSY
ncbi:uracil-DNA glycosylase [Mycolicibacterium chlorophenolicum]|uniref:uracil-DNA glycosylase n=1 Tax=Mycolicibacterium chlorophenolicum TaxID=37916 RepID=UPI00103EA417|nr:uracil-DNA glycosylase [Mycolicibacterium chlorophenolicum]